MDIKDIKHQKESLEKRIFNMIKKFEVDHGILVTDVTFWSDEKDESITTNLTLTTRFGEDIDRSLVKMEKENEC